MVLLCPLQFTQSYSWWGSEQWTYIFLMKLNHFPVLAPWSSSHITLFGVLDDPKYVSYTFINRWSFDDHQQKSNHFTTLALFLPPLPSVWGTLLPPPHTHTICRVLNYSFYTWITIEKSSPSYIWNEDSWCTSMFYHYSKPLGKVLLLLRGSQNVCFFWLYFLHSWLETSRWPHNWNYC